MYQHVQEFEDDTPFWFVWTPAGSAPTHKHGTLLAAKAEAERLARLNPGLKFHVLEAVGMCSHSSVHWVSVEKDQIPF